MLLASDLPSFSTYRPGWEISTDLVAFNVNGQVTSAPSTPITSPGTPSGTDGQGTDWTPGTWEIPGIGGRFAVYKFNPASNLQWDFDAPTWGMPDVRATAGDVREENPKWPYAPLTNDVGEYKYVTEYHEYLFDVQVRTIADMSSQTIATNVVWTHETSMPYQYQNEWGRAGDLIGKPVDGSVFVRFSTLPWGLLDYGPVPENYTFTGYWLGVMNAKCEKVETGIASINIAESDVIDKGWARGIESVGGPLNIYRDDGTFAVAYASIPWDDTKVLDPDISGTVILELPFNLMAGAIPVWDRWAFSGGGAIVQCKPVDYYLTYTVRMECLVTKEYAARDPGLPANPSTIEKPADYVPYTVPSFWDQYGTWIIIGAVLFVILLIILGWLGLPLLFFMGGR